MTTQQNIRQINKIPIGARATAAMVKHEITVVAYNVEKFGTREKRDQEFLEWLRTKCQEQFFDIILIVEVMTTKGVFKPPKSPSERVKEELTAEININAHNVLCSIEKKDNNTWEKSRKRSKLAVDSHTANKKWNEALKSAISKCKDCKNARNLSDCLWKELSEAAMNRKSMSEAGGWNFPEITEATLEKIVQKHWDEWELIPQDPDTSGDTGFNKLTSWNPPPNWDKVLSPPFNGEAVALIFNTNLVTCSYKERLLQDFDTEKPRCPEEFEVKHLGSDHTFSFIGWHSPYTNHDLRRKMLKKLKDALALLGRDVVIAGDFNIGGGSPDDGVFEKIEYMSLSEAVNHEEFSHVTELLPKQNTTKATTSISPYDFILVTENLNTDAIYAMVGGTKLEVLPMVKCKDGRDMSDHHPIKRTVKIQNTRVRQCRLTYICNTNGNKKRPRPEVDWGKTKENYSLEENREGENQRKRRRLQSNTTPANMPTGATTNILSDTGRKRRRESHDSNTPNKKAKTTAQTPNTSTNSTS